MSDHNSAPAGWYPDPSDAQRVPYWDGGNWSGPSRPTFPSTAPSDSLESPASTPAQRLWWQTWFAMVPGLLLGLPLGLLVCGDAAGLTVVKTAVTEGTVLLLGVGLLTPDAASPATVRPGSTSSTIPAGMPSDTTSASHLHRWPAFRLLRDLLGPKRSGSCRPMATEATERAALRRRWEKAANWPDGCRRDLPGRVRHPSPRPGPADLAARFVSSVRRKWCAPDGRAVTAPVSLDHECTVTGTQLGVSHGR